MSSESCLKAQIQALKEANFVKLLCYSPFSQVVEYIQILVTDNYPPKLVGGKERHPRCKRPRAIKSTIGK